METDRKILESGTSEEKIKILETFRDTYKEKIDKKYIPNKCTDAKNKKHSYIDLENGKKEHCNNNITIDSNNYNNNNLYFKSDEYKIRNLSAEALLMDIWL